jgi:hypothetical protein
MAQWLDCGIKSARHVASRPGPNREPWLRYVSNRMDDPGGVDGYNRREVIIARRAHDYDEEMRVCSNVSLGE